VRWSGKFKFPPFFVVEIVVCFIQLIEMNSNGIEFSLRLRGGGRGGALGLICILWMVLIRGLRIGQ